MSAFHPLRTLAIGERIPDVTVARKFLTVVLVCLLGMAGFAAVFDALLLALGEPLSLTQILIAVAVYATMWFGLLAWAARKRWL